MSARLRLDSLEERSPESSPTRRSQTASIAHGGAASVLLVAVDLRQDENRRQEPDQREDGDEQRGVRLADGGEQRNRGTASGFAYMFVKLPLPV